MVELETIGNATLIVSEDGDPLIATDVQLKKLFCLDGTIQDLHSNDSKDDAVEQLLFDWIFIDAEHTNIASFDDFLSAYKL